MNKARALFLVVALQLPLILPSSARAEPVPSNGPDGCPLVTLAETGFTLPGGGTLGVTTFLGGIINQKKEVLYAAGVDGDPRNQGVFVFDAAGAVTEIVRGCGSSGGQGNGGTCGDPTPIGGTFGGLFQDNSFDARFNDAGDVVFLADVEGGSSARGLFLYRASDQTTVKVVALGDPSPKGGTIAVIGNGVVNNQGQVAFLAYDVGSDPFVDAYLALWDDGALEVIVTPGDPTPDGAMIDAVIGGVVGFVDGTSAIISPTPSFDEAGRLAASVGATNGNGIMLFDDGASSWIVRDGEVTPDGVLGTTTRPMFRNGFTHFSTFGPDGAYIGTPGNWQAFWFEGQTIDGDVIDSIPQISGWRYIFDSTGQVTVQVIVPGDNNPSGRLARWNPTDGFFSLIDSQTPAPGGGTIINISRDVSVNQSGDVTFTMILRRDMNQFVFGLYRIDNCGVEIFADGFESGDTAAWSGSEP